MDRGAWQALGSQEGWTQLSGKTTITVESIVCIIFTDIYDSCIIIQSYFFLSNTTESFSEFGEIYPKEIILMSNCQPNEMQWSLHDDSFKPTVPENERENPLFSFLRHGLLATRVVKRSESLSWVWPSNQLANICVKYLRGRHTISVRFPLRTGACYQLLLGPKSSPKQWLLN